MFFVYAIKSRERNYIYVGLTNNVDRRLKEHNNYENRSTKAYAPFDLIFIEAFETRIDARKKELYLKSGEGKEYLKSLPGWRTCLPAGRIGRRKMFFVYAIKSRERNYIYVGLTNNVDRRLKEHNNYENRSTKAYAPFDLIFIEAFETRIDARKKELYLKSGEGKEYLKSLPGWRNW